MFKLYVKVFYVMGKALSGELSCRQTGFVEICLQYWIESLCNQVILEFASNQLETMQRCYKHVSF